MAANPRSDYQSADERSYGKLAVDIADNQHYGGSSPEPLHWPPGAPALFAVAHKLFPSASDTKSYDIRAAYWEQALLTTGTTALAALLAWLLAGPGAGGGACAARGRAWGRRRSPPPLRRGSAPPATSCQSRWAHSCCSARSCCSRMRSS